MQLRRHLLLPDERARSAVRLRAAALGALLLVLGAAGCRESPSAPAEVRVTLQLVGADLLHAPASTMLPVPVQVLALDAATGRPVKDVAVDWSVTGAAQLAVSTSHTDEYGVAAVDVMTTTLGSSRIRATSKRLQGSAPAVELQVVARPVVRSLAPAQVTPGAEVVISGENFAADHTRNAVLFDGVRGQVLAGSATELRVRAPACMPQRVVRVQAGIGYAVSDGVAAAMAASSGGTVNLAPGEALVLGTPAELACIRLTPDPAAQYLIITHNVAAEHGPRQRLELRSLGTNASATALAAPAPELDAASRWEGSLRRREAAWQPDVLAGLQAGAAPVVPAVGHRREFQVINSSNTFDKVTAVARVVSARAALYVDEASPGAFTVPALEEFAAIFDDPIHPVVAGVFGEPSDIDSNGRIVVLFTPRVNALTPRASSSFVAGYFYGCDLVSRSRCSGSNSGEIFYSMVPDPDGRWGDRRGLTSVFAAVPPVLAHEFQHMLHFGRRGNSTDALWLSEGLAHTAEELVADAYADRGDAQNTVRFRDGNHARARAFLAAPAGISLLGEDGAGTLGMRGAAWLLVQYLRGHYGGDALLRSLTGSTRMGVANVTAETGKAWEDLLVDFGIALWAHDARGLAGTLAPRHRFAGASPRAQLNGSAAYPLVPTTLSWNDFSAELLLAAGAQSYALLAPPSSSSAGQLNFVLSGYQGAPVDPARGVRLSILRVR